MLYEVITRIESIARVEGALNLAQLGMTEDPVITSYSIHYTKLYDVAQADRFEDVQVAHPALLPDVTAVDGRLVACHHAEDLPDEAPAAASA